MKKWYINWCRKITSIHCQGKKGWQRNVNINKYTHKSIHMYTHIYAHVYMYVVWYYLSKTVQKLL